MGCQDRYEDSCSTTKQNENRRDGAALDLGHILWCGRVVRVERAHLVRVVRGVQKMYRFEIEMRCAYPASERGCVLARDVADGVAANHKYRIVNAYKWCCRCADAQ
jgi:hypothetical protein